jgi:hypothetical protein
VLSLLGFNLGIEAMQLVIVVLVLPPLILLARVNRYRTLRIAAAAATALAAAGWLAARMGLSNPVADLADRIAMLASPVVIGLWLLAWTLTMCGRRQQARPTLNPAGLVSAFGCSHRRRDRTGT